MKQSQKKLLEEINIRLSHIMKNKKTKQNPLHCEMFPEYSVIMVRHVFRTLLFT